MIPTTCLSRERGREKVERRRKAECGRMKDERGG
jgi:hypothetical protein